LGVAGRIMKPMEMEHVEEREGGYYVADTRVSLDSIVYAFHEGESPETIQQKFPSLTPEEVMAPLPSTWGANRRLTPIFGKARRTCAAACLR
jgi:Protein of unknown function (DUF433)